uniref:Uncharacterized protein n=1 Tax=Enterococcus faecium TaxID=1352 RepID=G0WS07_ENTFC|nr:hypothetical protein [Enterococcus faecium]
MIRFRLLFFVVTCDSEIPRRAFGIVIVMSQLGKRYSLTKSNREVYTLFISDSAKEGFDWGLVFRSKKGQRTRVFLTIIVN